MEKTERLLILHCFGVWHNGIFYTEHPEQTKTYKEQLKTAFELLNDGEYDVLIISGGYTKLQIEKSEARGMLDLATELKLKNKRGLILLEEYARDSLENLLFSMCRHFQYLKSAPKSVGSCSWQFNVERYGIFAKKLSIPDFHVIPVGRLKNEELISEKWAKLAEKDPFYTKQSDSKEKYRNRDPWKKGHPYSQISPDFQRLFKKLKKLRHQGRGPEGASLLYPWRT